MENQHNPPTSKNGKRPRVLLLGYGCLAFSLLKGLLKSQTKGDCTISGVFQWSSRSKSRDTVDKHERLLSKLVKTEGLTKVVCDSVNGYAFTEILEKLEPDYLLFGSWGEIVKPHLLNQKEIGIINCHPALLPAHRGPNPYTSAITSGEAESGITFHWMTPSIDAGPILLKKSVPITPEDTGGSLRDKCGDIAQGGAIELMAMLIEDRNLPGKIQDKKKASYFPAIELEDGNVHWKNPVTTVVDQARGLQPWLDSFSFLKTPLSFLGNQPTMVLIRKITHAKVKPSQVLAGTILRYNGQHIEVASSNPEECFVLSEFSFYFMFFYLPIGCSQILGRLFLKPGKTFTENLS